MDAEVHPADGELVPVMVPRRLLSATYGFIAAQEQKESSPGTGGILHRGWTAPMIVEAYKAASNRMRVLLDLLASQADQRLYADDFMEALEVDQQDFINGVLGAFGRLTNQRFAQQLPDGKNTWPFSVSKDTRDGRWYYEMPSSVADVINAIDR